MAAKKPQQPPKIKPLSPRELAFCARYVELKQNGTRAYMAAYGTTNEAAARANASRLIAKTNVRAEVDRLVLAGIKAAQSSADVVIRNMSWIQDFDFADLIWQPGEIDSAGRAAHVRVAACSPGEEGGDPCALPHVGAYKPIAEMHERARKMIKGVKYDNQGNKVYELWSKDSAITNMAKYHKLLTDKIELSGKVSLADRVKAARAQVGL